MASSPSIPEPDAQATLPPSDPDSVATVGPGDARATSDAAGLPHIPGYELLSVLGQGGMGSSTRPGTRSCTASSPSR